MTSTARQYLIDIAFELACHQQRTAYAELRPFYARLVEIFHQAAMAE